MPHHLSAALDELATWPVSEGVPGLDRNFPAEHVVLSDYLDSIGAWQGLGYELDAATRARIVEIWKHRPDLRGALAGPIGYYVCDEFQRPFRRWIEAGGRGAWDRWVAAYPDLRAPLVEHYTAITARFNQPFEVVNACAILTRYLGAPPETWRAAALAIHRDDRHQTTEQRPSDFLRHDLETHGTLLRPEGALINELLLELGGTPLKVMEFGAWWHPYTLPTEEVRAKVAAASEAYGGGRA